MRLCKMPLHVPFPVCRRVELCKLTSGGAAVGILGETSQLTASRASAVAGKGVTLCVCDTVCV